jgi:acyl-CoA synthetase (AMP-forming)/AMP-acid ligase II
MIQDLLAQTASLRPGHPLLICGEKEISFSSLERMAISICLHFRRNGLRRGDMVIVLWDNGPEYAALFFGILMAGGVVVPLNPTNISEDVRYVASHCKARFLAVAGRSVDCVEGWWDGAPIVSEGTASDRCVPFHSIVESGDGEGGAPVGEENDLALVLYTSGTTGKPKGVMLTHKNLEANTRSILEYLGLQGSDRTLAILPFYYSYGNSLLLTHVARGATLVVENGFAFVNRCLETMQRSLVTGFSGVPSHFSILLNRSRFLELKWPHLRYMTSAGGGLPPAHIQKIRGAIPHVRLHIMYGQTEGAARLSSLDPELVDRKIGSMGKGIPGVTLRVADKNRNDVRPGEVGEVVAKGENIMVGYLGDPAGTTEVLQGGWLHTGDLATVDEEGYIYIRGREKEFIKSGGYRISPQQVEEALLQHPSVGECAVVGLPDEILGEKVVAMVVFRQGHAASEACGSLASFMRGKLPHYMVPQKIQPVDAIPKTDSGKVKRVYLKELASNTNP